MKKIFKIGAGLMAACVLATSVNIVALADSETKDILLYEDFESIDYSTAFSSGTTRNNYFGGVGSATTQYVKANRQCTPTLSSVADINNNKMMRVLAGSIGTCNTNGGAWGATIFQFDDLNSDGAYDKWVFDAENLDEELVVSYDVAVSEADLHTTTEETTRFYGVPISGTQAVPLNQTNAGGVFGPYVDATTQETKLRFGVKTTNSAGWSDANIQATGVGYDERVHVTYKFTKDGKYRIYVSHGNNIDTSNELTTPDAMTEIDQIQFVVAKGHALKVDDVRVYTVPADAGLAVTSADKTDVGLSESLDVTVNGYIPESELSKIVVKENGVTVNPDKYTVSVADSSSAVASTITVNFNDNMSPGKTYSVVFPTTLKDEAQDSFATETAANFATIAAPSFDIDLTTKVGSNAVSTLAAAAGQSVTCELDITHTTTRNSSGVIFVGLYDAAGNIVSFGASEKGYIPNETDTIEVSLNVPASTSGMSIKAFACESLTMIDNVYSSVATLQ